jgi:hypothetical protein
MVELILFATYHTVLCHRDSWCSTPVVIKKVVTRVNNKPQPEDTILCIYHIQVATPSPGLLNTTALHVGN